MQAPRLRDHARARAGLTLTAYQPLGKGEAHDDPVLSAIGEAHGVSAVAAALAFLDGRGPRRHPRLVEARKTFRANFAANGVRFDEEILDGRDPEARSAAYRWHRSC